MGAWQRRADDDGGFTLVELLVVVIILGVLAVMTVPQLLSQRQKAYEQAARSDLRNAVIELEQIVMAGGTYVSADPATLNGSDGVTFSFGSRSAAAYCLQVDHESISGGVDFHFDSLAARPEQGPC